MIIFENVSKYHQDSNPSLRDINLHIKHGEFLVLAGPSGSGKSTLLKILLAEEKPSEGYVHFDGVNIHNLRSSDIPKHRQRIGCVFQDHKLLDSKTVYENIAFAMEMVGKSDSDIRADVPYSLELVGLSHKMYSFPHQLSVGEQQRLSIARAIINQPDLLIADEPTASLDPEARDLVVSILKKVHEMGTTVVVATHDPHIIKQFKNQTLHLKKGRIIKDAHKEHKHS